MGAFQRVFGLLVLCLGIACGEGLAPSLRSDGGTKDATAGVVAFCTDDRDCDLDMSCFQANLSCASTMGFCVSSKAPSCAGFVGAACPRGLECVVETPSCGGADLLGACVKPVERSEICAAQAALWSCPPASTGP